MLGDGHGGRGGTAVAAGSGHGVGATGAGRNGSRRAAGGPAVGTGAVTRKGGAVARADGRRAGDGDVRQRVHPHRDVGRGSTAVAGRAGDRVGGLLTGRHGDAGPRLVGAPAIGVGARGRQRGGRARTDRRGVGGSGDRGRGFRIGEINRVGERGVVVMRHCDGRMRVGNGRLSDGEACDQL